MVSGTAGVTVATAKNTAVVRIDAVTSPKPTVDVFRLVEYRFRLFKRELRHDRPLLAAAGCGTQTSLDFAPDRYDDWRVQCQGRS